MQSKATTVEGYLAELPSDRRAAIRAVRDVILQNLDKDYEEGVHYGMISYSYRIASIPPGITATRGSRCRLPVWPRRRITCRCT